MSQASVACMDSDHIATLSSAILLYTSRSPIGGSDGGSFATVHAVKIGKGSIPMLSPGVAATREGLLAMTRSLSPGSSAFGFLPETVLAIGENHLVWWCPPTKRRVWFDCKELGKRNAVVSHPGLVFAVVGGDRYVFSVKGNRRPKPDTRLCQAPYFNVWDNGKVCEGSSRIPKRVSMESMQNWEDSFFDSAFTHPNVHDRNRLVRWAKGSFSFWKAMLDQNFKVFPQKTLVPLKTTAGDLVRGIEEGNGVEKR